MPIYSYKCDKCDSVVTWVRTIEQRDVIAECAECRGVMQRILDFGAASFKGSGFYSTDKNK